jgi:hypothetical protein
MPGWVQVLSALAAAVIGGVIAPQITQTRERRAARAAVLEKVPEVETLWFGDKSRREFRQTLAALEASAIIAGMPRELVRPYIAAAERARKSSSQMTDEYGTFWIVETRYTDPAKVALEHLSRAAWHPHLTQWGLRLRLIQPPETPTTE